MTATPEQKKKYDILSVSMALTTIYHCREIIPSISFRQSECLYVCVCVCTAKSVNENGIVNILTFSSKWIRRNLLSLFCTDGDRKGRHCKAIKENPFETQEKCTRCITQRTDIKCMHFISFSVMVRGCCYDSFVYGVQFGVSFVQFYCYADECAHSAIATPVGFNAIKVIRSSSFGHLRFAFFILRWANAMKNRQNSQTKWSFACAPFFYDRIIQQQS